MAVEFSKVVNQFSNDIYTKCAGEDNKNLILSPLSIQTAISLAYMGAKGPTADEMASVMKFGAIQRNDVANHFETFMTTVNNSPSVKIANKIYIQKGHQVKPEFNEIATKKFFSEAQNLDFCEAETSSKVINKWVEGKTNDKIKDLIKPDMLDSSTRMILVNAIYFKGSWVHQFRKESTAPDKFWTSETESVDVPMMHVKAKFNYGVFPELDAVGLEMPYENSDISMFVILPNKREGLKQLEADLSKIDYTSLYEKMNRQEVNVSFPKFKIEYEVKLKKLLTEMGMGTMFSDGADFSDLLQSTEPLKCADVVHKAFIEVNEEGAEAAAATAFMFVGCCAPMITELPIMFDADHPFIYIFRDSVTSFTYFTGRTLTV